MKIVALIMSTIERFTTFFTGTCSIKFAKSHYSS